MKLHEAAQLVQGQLQGDAGIDIRSIASLEDADSTAISFLSDVKYSGALQHTCAGAVLIPADFHPERIDLNLIAVSDVDEALEKLLIAFAPPALSIPPGVHPTAVVAPSASLGADAAVGAHAVIGDHVVIGDHTTIGEGCVIRAYARIGSHTVLHPNVVVEDRCEIGSGVILFANTTIGTDGFGYRFVNGVHKKIPHIGIVVIEDDVEIGANCCVDRAKFGKTIVGRGSKIDNLTQIAHNVVLGQHCLVVSQVGIAGSARLGNYVVLGGQAGVSDHIRIGDGAMVAGSSAVKDDVPAGVKMAGTPAVPLKEWVRDQLALRKLLDLSKHYKKIMQLLSDS